MALFWVQNSNVWIHQRSKFIEYLIEFIEIYLFFEIVNSLNYWIRRNTKLHYLMLKGKVEFIKLLNLSKPWVRRSFIFVEPLHLANYQIHQTSEFIEISNSWKRRIQSNSWPGLGPVLHVHRSPTNPCEALALRSARKPRGLAVKYIFWPTTHRQTTLCVRGLI